MGNKVQNVLLGVLAVGLIGITVAYAALSQRLDIQPEATVKKSTWDVEFANVACTASNLNGTTTTAVVDTSESKLAVDGKTTIKGSMGTLKTPGDTITCTFDIVNKGDIDAKITTAPVVPTPTCATDASSICSELTYTLTYADSPNTAIKVNDELATGATKAAKIVLTYKKDSTKLTATDVKVGPMTSYIIYGQK